MAIDEDVPAHHDASTCRGAASAPRADVRAEPTTVDGSGAWDIAQLLIGSRQHVSPKRLVAPGPDAQQIEALFMLAAAAPDHGTLTPWRFVIVPADKRALLGEAFAQALLDRDPAATPAQLDAAREKAQRGPLLVVAVARLGPREADIGTLERMVSMGAAIQNILLGAHALGFGAGLTSGRAMGSPRLAALLELIDAEVPVCCITIGTVSRRKPRQQPRPAPSAFVSTL